MTSETTELTIQRRKEILDELRDRWVTALMDYEVAEKIRVSITAVEREAYGELLKIIVDYDKCLQALVRMEADNVARV